jgi:2-polyprenyl-3-methyl-5-hydroxy-6-metoxy-1,4-benzoquinol methylase
MQVQLLQRGRASMHFAGGLAQAVNALEPRIRADIAAQGLSDETMPDDLAERVDTVEEALGASKPYHIGALGADWLWTNHPLFAISAFEAIRPEVEPALKAAQSGPTTLEANPDLPIPDYFKGVEFHRTTGGWDGHEYMGFIHGHVIQTHYLAYKYPRSDKHKKRSAIDELPRQAYKRVLDMGTSSGLFALRLADRFPQAEIWGCDLSLSMLQQAQRWANERGYRWTLHRVAAEDTGFAAGSFDLVTSNALFHELPASAIRAIWREAYRLLEPGGDVMMVDVPPFAVQSKASVWRACRDARHGGEPYWSQAASLDPAREATEAGFVDVRSFGLNGEMTPWVTVGRKPL